MVCRVALLSAPYDARPGGEAAAERTAAGGGGATSARGEPEQDTWIGHWPGVNSTIDKLSQDSLCDSLWNVRQTPDGIQVYQVTICDIRRFVKTPQNL